ncbi:MAG: hypothetical protein CL582_01270 [Alteromonadaceae bacterium]|nr:hypothetical protein [Alteromonadaceae bacterium]
MSKKIRLGLFIFVCFFSLPSLSQDADNRTPDPDYDTPPPEITQLLSEQCDSKQLSVTDCVGVLSDQLINMAQSPLPTTEQEQKEFMLKKGYLAEAGALLLRNLISQSSPSDREYYVRVNSFNVLVNMALESYMAADHNPRKWAMLLARVEATVMANTFNPEVLNQVITVIDNVFGQLPEVAPITKFKLLEQKFGILLTLRNNERNAQFSLPREQRQCDPQQLEARLQTRKQLEEYAKSRELWPQWVNFLRIYAGGDECVQGDNLDTSQFFADKLAARELAIEHGLYKQAVQLLLEDSTVNLPNAPGHPDVIKAYQNFTQAENLANGDAKLLLDIALQRFTVALKAGLDKGIREAERQFEQRIKTYAEQGGQELTWQEMAVLYEKYAIYEFNRGNSAKAAKVYEEMQPFIERYGNEQQLLNWKVNLQLLRLPQSDPTSVYQNLLTLHQQANNEEWATRYHSGFNFSAFRIRENLAYVAELNADQQALGEWLPMLADDELGSNSDKESAGLYHYYLALWQATHQQIAEAKQNLSWVEKGFKVDDEMVKLSSKAIEASETSPDFALQINRSMLRPKFFDTFHTDYFSGRLNGLQDSSVYLVSTTAQGKNPLPALTVGKHLKGQQSWLRAINQLAVTPDGQVAIHCLSSGRCTLWQTQNGRTLRDVQVGSEVVQWLRIPADGKSFFTVSGQLEQKVRQWDIDTGRLLATYYPGPSNGRTGMALTTSGRYLAMTGDGGVAVWDTATGQPLIYRQSDYLSVQTSEFNMLPEITAGKHSDEFLLTFYRGEAESKEFTAYRWSPITDQLTKVVDWMTETEFNSNIGSELAECRISCIDYAQSTQSNRVLYAEDLTGKIVVQSSENQLQVSRDGSPQEEYRLDTDAVKHIMLDEENQWLWTITQGARTKNTWDVEWQLNRWDLQSGRSETLLNLPSLDHMLSQNGYLWQVLGERIQVTELSQQPYTKEVRLPDWPDGTSPDVETLWWYEDSLWALETNGYYGDERVYKVRQMNPGSLDTLSLVDVHSQDSWLAPDTQHNRLVFVKSNGYDNPGQLIYVDAATGEQLNTLDVDYEMSSPTPALTLLSDLPATLQSVQGRYEKLRGYAPDGSVAWQWDSTVGDISSLNMTPDKLAVLVEVDGEESSFIYRIRLTDGQVEQHWVTSGQLMQLVQTANNRTLLMATVDGRILWWPTQQNAPLLSLMHLADSGFLVVDQRGFYDSNRPGDIPAVSWVMADEPRKALPLEAFMRDFYQPGLFGRLLAGEILQLPTTLSDLNRVPPKVDIVSVETQSNGKARITVKVEDVQGASAHSGAEDVRVFRNGQLVGFYPENDGDALADKTQTTITFDDIAIPPNASELVFSAYAFNKDGVRSERSVVTYKPSDSQRYSPRLAIVISIGVNEYENPSWNLRYAANDALVMEQTLGASMQALNEFDDVIRIPLISAPGQDRRATKKQLHQVVEQLHAGTFMDADGQPIKADINDVLFVTFSGHGYVHDNGQFYFLLEDIGSGSQRQINQQVLNNALSSDELSHWLRPLDVQQMVMVVDACHSAASIASSDFKPGPMGSRGLGQLAYDKAMLFLTASQAEQFAMESDNLQHGFLSYALLVEGLQDDQADFLPQDKQVGALEWLQYGAQRVPQISVALSKGEFNAGSRGFSLKKKENKPAVATQKPYLFDFSQDAALILKVTAGAQ